MSNTKVSNNTEQSDNAIFHEPKWKIVIRICIIVFLFLLLLVSYLSMFYTGSMRRGPFTKFVGVLDSSKFYKASAGDLIVVNKIEKPAEIKVGDIIIYQINGEVGSAVVNSMDYTNRVAIVGESEYTNISFESVIGKQGAIAPIFGYLFGFITSPYGAIVISLILLAYIYYINFYNLNKEHTEKGKALLEQLRIEKYEAKQRKKLLEEYRKNDGFTPSDASVIDGTMGDNLIALVSFAPANTNKTQEEIYKYLLEKIHRTYMSRPKLNKKERTRVTNIMEMAPIMDSFDEDVTYKLIDLVLHEPLTEFDVVGFEKLAIKFLSKDLTQDNVCNFGEFLYVLVHENRRFNKVSLKKIVSAYKRKVENFMSPSDELRLILQNLTDISI